MCKKSNQLMTSFKAKNIVYIDRPLQLLHMDHFGTYRTVILGGIIYALVVVDEYSLYT